MKVAAVTVGVLVLAHVLAGVSSLATALLMGAASAVGLFKCWRALGAL